MTPEGKVKAEIKKALKARGAYQFWPVQRGFGAATVDCLACDAGRFIAIEVKREDGGVLTGRQKATLHEVALAGGIAVVARSWEEVLHAIDNHGHGRV